MVIGSRVSGYKQKNQESIQEIKEKHNKLNFQIRNNGERYVQCENPNCQKWVKCHPDRSVREPKYYQDRRIMDVVPLYSFNGSQELYCGQCFCDMYNRYRRRKYH
jgi:hypothetical protein